MSARCADRRSAYADFPLVMCSLRSYYAVQRGRTRAHPPSRRLPTRLWQAEPMRTFLFSCLPNNAETQCYGGHSEEKKFAADSAQAGGHRIAGS